MDSGLSLDEISQMSANSSSTAMTSLHKAAIEYEEKVVDSLKVLLERTFVDMWNKTLQQIKSSHLISKRLAMYQKLLTSIPDWNTMRLESMANTLNQNDIETLVQGLVMVKTKIQSILSSPDTKILMKVPTLQYVIHTCSIETARLLYRNVDLMDTMISKAKQIQNRRMYLDLIEKGIRKGIDSFVPTVALLRKQSKQIEERLRQELCIPSETNQSEQMKESVELQTLSTRDIVSTTMPVIRDAPPIMEPENKHETINVPQEEEEDEKRESETVNPPEEEEIKPELPSLEAPEEPLQPKHVITVDPKKDEEPLMITDMKHLDEKSFNLSLAVPNEQPVKNENDMELFE